MILLVRLVSLRWTGVSPKGDLSRVLLRQIGTHTGKVVGIGLVAQHCIEGAMIQQRPCYVQAQH